MTKPQTTVELVEELIPQAILDQQEQERKEKTYNNRPKTKEDRLETLEGRDDDLDF